MGKGADEQTDHLMNKAHRGFAKAVFVTGQPLSLLEHPLWVEALQNLKPDYKPPTRRILASSLLTLEFEETKLEIMERINSATVLHLAIDGWSNLRNDSIMNIIIYTPKPFFYKFIDTKTNRHTAEYVCDKVSEVLEEIGSHKFFVIISDNATNMVKCGRLLNEKYANVTWIGCLAHTLNLLIGDVIKVNVVLAIFHYVVEVVKKISKSHILKSEFKRLSEDKSINVALVLPVKTRWGSYLHCLENFLKAKVILQTMVISDIRELDTYKENILNEAKWAAIENHIRFFTPIVHWISKLEGDYCTIHLVYGALLDIEELLNSRNAMDVLEDNLPQLRGKFLERKQNALNNLHFAAVILDPKYRGSNLSGEDYLEGCNAIMNLATTNDESINVLQELSEYKCRNRLYGKNIIWQAANTIDPKDWWMTFFEKTLLGQIAIKILTVPATSASVERSFSTFSHIHSRKRNKLTTERAGKICYISHNWKLMNENATRYSVEKADSSVNSQHETSNSINLEISDSDDDFDLEPVDFRSVTEIIEEDNHSDRFTANDDDDPLNLE
ncbi:unnamed protein product [Diatraea saccharalis]|uniref:Uncharacterized protein n=1 Tax=Diatraea saccharalis TaxID=40085 RepID=A0A9N9WIH4_9NEOP|nr:unnamed protein product [Diatraea saccharalis]